MVKEDTDRNKDRKGNKERAVRGKNDFVRRMIGCYWPNVILQVRFAELLKCIQDPTIEPSCLASQCWNLYDCSSA